MIWRLHRPAAAALLLSCLGAGATPAATGPEIPTSPAAREAALTLLSMQGEEHNFEMSNGRRLVLTAQGHELSVRYGRRALALLHHDGQGRFVSSDGRVVLRLGLDEQGKPAGVSLVLPAPWA